MDGHHHTLSAESSTSAIDLTGTPAGIGSSGPSSPALVASESSNSFARRRTSWGGGDTIQDPLRFELDLSDRNLHTSTPRQSVANWADTNDDPFFSPVEDDDSPPPFSFRNASRAANFTSQPGPSAASLISSMYRSSETDSVREDDEAHLTANMSRRGSLGNGWSQADERDPESSRTTTRSRRKTVRYSSSPSPLKKTGTRLMAVSRNIRRVSLRVVNFAGRGLEDHVRLDDAEQEIVEEETGERTEEGMPELSSVMPLRGRTLGFMGPENSLRHAMFRFLVYECVTCCRSLSATLTAPPADGPNLLFCYSSFLMRSFSPSRLLAQ